MFTLFGRNATAKKGSGKREGSGFKQVAYEKVYDLKEEVDEVDFALDEEEDEEEGRTPVVQRGWRKQLTVIYILFLAEAIMASSLQSQLKMLITKDDFCGNLSTSYLESTLECAYAVGSVAGLFWGWLADRVGRRRVALVGVVGMAMCCIGMGFATDLLSCAIFRFIAGLVGSSIGVTTLTMIGDISHTPMERAKNIARLPLIALCGSIGPLVQGMISESVKAHNEIWGKFPILSSQITCGSLVLVITVGAFLLLEETLPGLPNSRQERTATIDIDSEKAAFLGQSLHEETYIPSIRIVDIDTPKPTPISISQIIRAPSLVVLLASYSLLSLHSTTFDQLLPHLGHSTTHHGGMGISCSRLQAIITTASLIAGAAILLLLPRAVAHFGLLRPYRFLSLAFPAVYALTPALALLATASPTQSQTQTATAAAGTLAILLKKALEGSTASLVTLLVLNAPPDAYSTGTIVGLMHLAAAVFQALAVGVAGASFGLAGEVGVGGTGWWLWGGVGGFGVVGAAGAWFVREWPVVGRDWPEGVLRWETCFESESESESEGEVPVVCEHV